MIIEYSLVFLGAAIPWFEIALVIPLGIISGLNPIAVTLIAFIGNMVTILALIIGYDKFKTWLANRQENKKSKRQERARTMWNKYGLPGMVMLAHLHRIPYRCLYWYDIRRNQESNTYLVYLQSCILVANFWCFYSIRL